MEQELEIIEGVIRSVTFQNPSNGYCVLKLDAMGEQITVVGIIPMAICGERLIVTGKWTTHSNYGRQFEAEFLERMMPSGAEGILRYLSSRVVHGIGPVTAHRIVQRFGDAALDVLEHDPERLAEVEGITKKKARAMNSEFRRIAGIRRLMEFLSAHCLPAELAMRLYREYGETAMEAVQDDPYLLTDTVFGADFAVVDAFAMDLGVAPEDGCRLEAGILFELSYNLNAGHVFIPRDKLLEASVQLLEQELSPVSEALDRLECRERVICDVLLGQKMCYLPEYREAEVLTAQRLSQMARLSDDTPRNLENLVRQINERREGGYAEKQLEAIRMAAKTQLLLVTGGPGTGKTTTMRGILALFDMLGLKTQLAAPTGRAAKRLSECAGREAATIHRLLESGFDPESGEMQFFRDEDEPLDADALIVDEASMIDLLLMSALLRAMKRECRLVLVGDPDQLPSVGAGNVFSDILRSGVAQTVRLTEVFRQAQKSLIVMNAHAVNGGKLPELHSTDRDFFFLRRPSGADVVRTVCELVSQRLPKRMGIAPEDIQVLSPTRRGIIGTGNLNKALQQALNPAEPDRHEKLFGDSLYREGDRVIQTRNDYDIAWRSEDGTAGSGIFNGDIGVIRAIDPSAQTVTVAFDEKTAEYPFEQLYELEPAYAITVHKSQGSEYRAVVLTLLGTSGNLCTRSVLYTAITRAKELLIVVGSDETVAAMVANDARRRRYSGLKLRLEALQ